MVESSNANLKKSTGSVETFSKVMRTLDLRIVLVQSHRRSRVCRLTFHRHTT